MTYEKICEYIYEIPKFTKKNDLTHTKELLRRLKIAEQQFEIIHVAGSNGKGSVCAFINQVLVEQGVSVGLFTSPHLVCMEERFVINGRQCSREQFVESFHVVKQVVEEMENEGMPHPAFFEFLFAMGLFLFAKEKVRYLVLETGLGGRLDATNVFEEPLLTIITSISMEHTEILGDTIEAIAAEKAGIIKEGIPVLFDGSNPSVIAVIKQQARERRAPFYYISLENLKFNKITGKNIDFSYLTGYDDVNLKIPFVAMYQMMNAALAYKALYLLQEDTRINPYQIVQSMEHTRWPGRMQQVTKGVYFDGAHNVDGIAHFLETVHAIGGKHPILLFSMVKEKDYVKAIEELCQDINWDTIIVSRIQDSRALEPKLMAEEFQRHQEGVVIVEDSKAAYQYALDRRKENQVLFCAGSLYLIGELEEAAGGIEI